MASPTKPDTDESTQLEAYVEAHGTDILISGRGYAFENFRIEVGRGRFADALTKRAKYLAMQTKGKVTECPGAEPWVIMRTSGGGDRLARFAIHDGKLIELTSA